MTAPDHFAEANLTSFAGGGSSTYDFCNEAREFDRRITGNPSHGMNRKEPASCMQVGCPCRSRLGVGNAALRRLSDGVPKIAVMNESTVFADDSVKHMLPAFKQQWNKDLAKTWGIGSATLSFISKHRMPPQGTWWLVFLDDSDQAGALAYHDLTNEGLPISKVFVKTLMADNASISVGATHELCEMAVDPWLNSAYQDPKGIFWAGEVCDPTESDQYGYKIGDVLVSDFILPAWYAHQNAMGPVDFMGHLNEAFGILSGGYAQYFDDRRGWVQITGSLALHTERAKAPRGSRRERRTRVADCLCRSEIRR